MADTKILGPLKWVKDGREETWLFKETEIG
jgi:hypothetical protein